MYLSISALIFGTSNIKRFKKRLYQMFKELNLNVELEITYTLDQLITKINKFPTEDKWCALFHILGNDARDIADMQINFTAKKSKAIEVAKTFLDLVVKFSKENPHMEIFISTLLERFDGDCKEQLQKIINLEIRNGFKNQVFDCTNFGIHFSEV